MTVGELRKSLDGVADDVPVTIFLGDKFLKAHGDYMAFTASAKHHKPTGISGEEVEIVMGNTFSY